MTYLSGIFSPDIGKIICLPFSKTSWSETARADVYTEKDVSVMWLHHYLKLLELTGKHNEMETN